MSSGGEEKRKTRACTECHKSKNKCVFPPEQTVPHYGLRLRCERCIRLDKECTPHLSRQGKRKRLSLDEGTGGNAPQAPAHGLTNQAQLIDMVESGNLQQLSNNLNLGAFQGNNVGNNLSQQQRLNNGTNPLQRGATALLQAVSNQKSNGEPAASAESLTMLLSRALGGSSSGAGGGGNSMPPPQPQGALSQASLLSNLDPAKLTAMISQLKSSMSNNNGNINSGNSVGNQVHINNSQMPSSSNNMGAQPSASALLMLAGTSASGGGGMPNNFNAISNNYNNNGGSSTNNVMGYTAGGGAGTAVAGERFIPASRSSSMGHGPSSMFVASDKEIGRRNSLPLVSGNDSQAGGNGSLYSNATGGTSEGVLKKQKKFLPSNNNFDNAGDASGSKANPPPHIPYPSISLLRQDSSTNLLPAVAAANYVWSRQNQRTSSQDGGNALSRSSSASNLLTPEDAIGNHIARACAKHAGQKLTSLKNHYGLQCQIREWISMALARRSFALLAKASTLANRCGIHMDRIFSGVADEADEDGCNVGRRMNYLLATLLEPREHQVTPIVDRHMLIPHLPQDILSIVGCQDCPTFRENEMRNRWIIIRETRQGITRFYCSPAFERNVLCWTHISQIYEDNLADINSLIFVKEDFRKFLACNAHQISLHSSEGLKPKPVRAFKTKIRLLGRQWGQAKYGDPSAGKITKEMIRQVQEGQAMTLEMDLRFVSFPAMDKTTYYLEFFHHSRGANSSTGTGTSWQRTMSDASLDKTGAAAQQSANMPGGEKAPAPSERIVSQSPGREAPPTFEDVIDSEDWVGINDALASGDIDDLIASLLD